MTNRTSRPLLVINPNSSESITNAIKPLLNPLTSTPLEYFTAPPPAPLSINDAESAEASARVCLPALLPLISRYSGLLVACYSDHPLVPQLKQYTTKPVIGIFEASISHALLIRGSQPHVGWGIVTTSKAWEDLLSIGVGNVVGEDGGGFEGVESTGLNADELHRVGEDELRSRIHSAVTRLVSRGKDVEVKIIILGCAGMAGMEEMVVDSLKRSGKSGYYIIDGVKAGVTALEGVVNCQYGDVRNG